MLGRDTICNVLCEQTFTEEHKELLKERIDNEYTGAWRATRRRDRRPRTPHALTPHLRAVGWLVDGLPASVRMYEDEAPDKAHLERGFPIGFSGTPPNSDKRNHYIFNHIQFVLSYHQEPASHVAIVGGDEGPGGGLVPTAPDTAEASEMVEVDPKNVEEAKAAGAVYRIVGFEVEPFTGAAAHCCAQSHGEGDTVPPPLSLLAVKHRKRDESLDWADNLETCNSARQVTRDSEPQMIDEGPDTRVVFTYDVVWAKSNVAWHSRMDVFLQSTSGDSDIHWFSIINSLMIVLFLTGMIAMILVRNLYRDIARYNEEAAGEDATEETGWKLVHGDVFRPPAGFFGPMFLSVFVGSGMQILAMSLVLLFFAVLGFLSPANQGSLLTAFIVLFMLMGSFAGYFSARLYKMFKGKAWKRNTTLTAFAFPGTIYGTAFLLNLIVWQKKSSLAVPITTMLLLFALWFGVSVPLVFAGSYLGFKAEEIKHPVRVKNIPRQIPAQPWYLHPLPSILVGGILPFGAVFIELFFIMSSIWLAQMYYFFSFLLVVLLILVVTCAEISIVMTYFQLCAEDYNWWWRSFLTSGSSALYLFLYAIVYFVTKLDITAPAAIAWYFGYMIIASWGFFLLTGSIGFVSSLTFVNRIYGAIKVD